MAHKDPAARAAYLRTYRAAHAAERRANRPDEDRTRRANDRARHDGAGGRLTVHDVRAVMAAGSCHYCGGTHLLGMDHVVPLHAGGANERGNLVCCCRACNASKFRQDRPDRWSRTRDECASCGRSDRPHGGYGLCRTCLHREYMAKRRAAR